MNDPIIDSIFDIVNATAGSQSGSQQDAISPPAVAVRDPAAIVDSTPNKDEGAAPIEPEAAGTPEKGIGLIDVTGITNVAEIIVFTANANVSNAHEVTSSAAIFDSIYEDVNASSTAADACSQDVNIAVRDSRYPEWSQAIERIAHSGGTVLIVGPQDSGKTSFARCLRGMIEENGRSAACIDADLKQGEIGPPGCVGLSFNGLHPTGTTQQANAIAFVGAITPQRRFLEYLTGLRLLLNRVPISDVVVDAGGLASGGALSMRHANALLSLLSPSHVVVIRRREEHQDIVAAAMHRAGCTVHVLPVPGAVQPKNSILRSKRLVTQFASYFEDSQIITLGFDDVTILGTWLGGAKPLASHLLKFVSNSVGQTVRVYYGEQSDRHLGLMVDKPIPDAGNVLGLVHDQLKTNAATVTEAPRLKHLLVGLEDGNGTMLGLGLLEALDFNRRTLGIQTPMRSVHAARAIHFGEMRMQPDGTELGMLRRGEL